VTSYLKRREDEKGASETERHDVSVMNIEAHPPLTPNHPVAPIQYTSSDQLSTRVARKKQEAAGMDTPGSSIADPEKTLWGVFSQREVEDVRKR
jgi:hypothetical protein